MQLIWVLCFRVSHEAANKVSMGTSFSSEGLTGEEFPSKPKHVTVGRIQFLMGCRAEGLCSSLDVSWRLFLVLCHVGLSIRQLTTWNLAFLRVSNKERDREGMQCANQSFCNLISKVPSHHSFIFYSLK